MKKILKDSFIKSILKNAAGYTIEQKVLKIFNINDELSETVIKNRITFPYKNFKIKNNSLLIKF